MLQPVPELAETEAMSLTSSLSDAGRGAPALVVAAVWALATTAAAEPFASVDAVGHTHLGHVHPPANAATSIDELRSLWRGRATDFGEVPGAGTTAAETGWHEASNDHFRLWLDGTLEVVGAVKAEWALGVLESARSDIASSLGGVFEEPLVVILYAEPTYAGLHDERFGFPTVGFFDGRLHVAAPSNDLDALRSRIRHEFAHAIFRARAGGDRPFWLNEGWALRSQRSVGGHSDLRRVERAWLRSRSLEGRWIPLAELREDFSRRERDAAKAAYLQSALAVEWFEAHTAPPERARFMRRMAEGFSVDQALYEATGLDSRSLDRQLQDQLRTHMPPPGHSSGS